MKILTLQLNQFRNYRNLELEFDPGTNLFYGDNAQGKTNILESIYLCGTTRSHKGARDREMIRFESEDAHIRMEMEKADTEYRLDMHLKKNGAKGIAVNGVPVRKASELVGIGNFIFFSPEDLNLIKSGPVQRRRFLDMELCQLDPVYLHNLSAYNKCLNQRNKLIRDLYFHPEYEEMLDVWDVQMVRYGDQVIRARQRFVEELNDIYGQIHRKLSGGKEQICLIYEMNTHPENLAGSMKENRERDKKLKMTHAGPHRDDLSFEISGVDVRKYGSQGQQRTAALSLKLSEIELVKRRIHDTPVLLLDDVLSELDSGRQQYLLENIHDIQTFITGTGTDRFVKNHFSIGQLFYVTDGTVQVGR